MKKVAIVLALVFAAVLFNGCFTTMVVAEIGSGIADDIKAIKAVKREKEEADRAAAEAGRKRTLDEHMRGRQESPFINSAEERLSRRTSALTGGTQVDPTPYLFHQDSFAVMNNEIWHNKSIIDIDSKFQNRGSSKNQLFVFEIAVTADFEVNKQPQKVDLTVVTCTISPSAAKSSINKYIWNYIANDQELKVADIKNRKLQYTNIQKGKTKMVFTAQLKCDFVPLFLENVEPAGYYEFDVEVEYQKSKPMNLGPLLFVPLEVGKVTFETFENVYRCDFKTLAAATLEAQAAIWAEAGKKSSLDKKLLPLPVINFVRVEKYSK